jgi:adenine-specific DNA methylase
MKNLTIKDLPSDWFFPTTRYRGSKRKILSWIWEKTKDIPFNTVLDLFGGTSVVSILFKRMGKGVTYNDYSFYNYLAGTIFVENQDINLSNDDIDFILGGENNDLNFISNNFQNYYFLDKENQWLDKTIGRIFALQTIYTGATLKYKQAIAIWALGQACLIKRPFNLFHRKNLNLRTRSVIRNFGNKTTWEIPFDISFQRFVQEANKAVFDNRRKNLALNSDAFHFSKSDFDLVYLDPPYFFKNQSDENYQKLYHFLDGIAQYEKWEKLIDYSSPIRALKASGMIWPSKSPEKLTNIYLDLIKKFKNSTIVISHKAGSLVPVQELLRQLEENGKSCEVHNMIYSYALNKQNGKSHDNIECLIIGK